MSLCFPWSITNWIFGNWNINKRVRRPSGISVKRICYPIMEMENRLSHSFIRMQFVSVSLWTRKPNWSECSIIAPFKIKYGIGSLHNAMINKPMKVNKCKCSKRSRGHWIRSGKRRKSVYQKLLLSISHL